MHTAVDLVDTAGVPAAAGEAPRPTGREHRMTERIVLPGLDVAAVRFSLELSLGAVLTAAVGFEQHRRSLVPRDPALIRRRLLADALRLTPSMAPTTYAQAEDARRVLGIAGELEIHQSAGRENAGLHLVESPILLEIQGRLLALVDHDAGVALFGHELGHYLAHGPWTEHGAIGWTAIQLAESGLLAPVEADAARRLVVAREITADRFGLLAAQSLEAALRLEMIATTGLSAESLTWDTAAYLAQSRELMESLLARGETAMASTHPEHSLRAWALWLYSESDGYRALTGQGSGARKLAEVDELVARALGSAELDTSYDARDDVPGFLTECALACAVLVAAADEEISAQERDAIEDAFARSVPGWAELLDPEVALARFHETGAMVRAGGTDLVRRLFLLITHVMGADDVVDAREVQMIFAIGEALGHGGEFRRWIRPAIAAIGAPVQVDLLEVPPMPLPVRKGEVQDALAALCSSVQRRGESVIAPRRLLRLAGATVGDAAALARVSASLQAHGIESRPPLGEAAIDQPVTLVATHWQAVPVREQPELSATRQSLLAALARLRDELISGDGRSPSVRLRRLVSGRAFDLTRLDRVRPGTAERVLQLVDQGQRALLVTPEDAGNHEAAAECAEELRLLDRAQRDRQEETGANDLYLGYPIVVGNVAPRGETATGYGVRAPLVLHPVELRRDGRGARGFSLVPRAGEEPIANQSLVRLVFNKAGLALPDRLSTELDEIAADPAQGTADLLAKLREVGVTIVAEGNALAPFRERDRELDVAPPFLAVEECALLGLFAQSSSDLLHDFDGLLRELAAPEAALGELLSAAAALLPAGLAGEAATPMPTPTDAAIGWPVVAADPSQRAVAASIRGNRVTVVDGPPGTGKSQLIVNLVADALRRGERIAVVAEKRAALDVVAQRLHGRGLGRFVSLVHDVNEDRKPLFERIRARLETAPAPATADARRELLRTEYEQAERSLDGDAGLLTMRCVPAGLSHGQLLALASSGPALVQEPGLALLDVAALPKLLELVERLHAHRELWTPPSWWRSHGARGSLHVLDDNALFAVGERVRAAIERADAYARLHAQLPVAEPVLVAAQAGIAAVEQSQRDRAGPTEQRLWLALLVYGDPGVDAVARAWSERSAALARWNVPLRLAVDDAFVAQVAVLRSFAGKAGRVFAPLWWRTRGAVRDALARVWPEHAAAAFDEAFLDELHARIEAARAWAQATELFARLGVPELAPQHADAAPAAFAMLGTLVATARTVAGSAGALAQAGAPVPNDAAALVAFDRRIAELRAQLQARDALRSETTALAPLFPWLDSAGAAELRALLERLRADGHRVRELDGWLQLMDELSPRGRALLDATATASPEGAIPEWREAIARAWAQAHLDRAQTVVPRLAELGTLAADQRAQRGAATMRELDAELRDLEVAAIAAALDDVELVRTPNAAYRARRTDPQKRKEQLLKEVGKKSRLMPLRTLVREFADDGLLDVLPCWLLSPETMAVLFPRAPLFDLVVFDEASQCTVEAGLPAMLRARRAVVVGDEKQMPPTSFFELGGSSTEDEDRREDELAARDAFSSESLLALARARCPHVGLTWHYRCRDESLIAFSNHALYDGELLTIPTPGGDANGSALRWLHVPDGVYDAGLNRPEAERVVGLLAELLARSPRPTVGVVTFNLRQRQTVLEAIEARVASDTTFAEHWHAANEVDAIDERPFVKNLESVQGDERDVVVFSLGHAPVERKRKGGASEIHVPARFGPLGQRGGERRLNVAISRAKSECWVVASFDPKDLHTGDAMHDGPRLFKGFLEFAHAHAHGRGLEAQRILDEVRGHALQWRDTGVRAVAEGHLPLPTQIALALEGTGLRCELGLGSSHFRIPLAIGRADEPGLRLAVLTEEGSGASAFERHVHRPNALELRGWDVMHVDIATWSRRRRDVLAEIELRLQR